MSCQKQICLFALQQNLGAPVRSRLYFVGCIRIDLKVYQAATQNGEEPLGADTLHICSQVTYLGFYSRVNDLSFLHRYTPSCLEMMVNSKSTRWQGS